jgi:hypothetical protein
LRVIPSLGFIIEDIFPFNNLSPVSVLRLPDCLPGYATMLFRVVRPNEAESSRSAYFVQCAPADIKHRLRGVRT